MSENAGTIGEIWRYPVKSMIGERVASSALGKGGIPGDRAWAVRDEKVGAIRGAKKIPALMKLAACYPAEPRAAQAGPAEIALPDGERFSCDAADADARLSAALDRKVTLWPLQPADKLDHYRRGAPDHEDLEQELRSLFALLPEEPLPDLSGLPPEVFEFESPPGTYFDAFPLLVLSTSSLAELARLAPDSTIDVRRFRPNILIDSGTQRSGFVELEWVGKRLRVGSAVIEIKADCPRCVMTTLPFADLPHDPTIMRTLVRDAKQVLGVYADVVEAGEMSEGDAVELVG